MASTKSPDNNSNNNCSNKKLYETATESITIVLVSIIFINNIQFFKNNDMNYIYKILIFSLCLFSILFLLNNFSNCLYKQVLGGIGFGLGSKLFTIPVDIIGNLNQK